MGWWTREIGLLEPKVVVLLGKPAAESFGRIMGDGRSFKTFLDQQFAGETPGETPGETRGAVGEAVEVGKVTVRRFVVPHPTAPNPD